MNTEDQHSADEIVALQTRLHFMIGGQKNFNPKFVNSKTINYKRRDRYGNVISKGGKQRICFKDKIEGEKNRLCEIVNISKDININCGTDNKQYYKNFNKQQQDSNHIIYKILNKTSSKEISLGHSKNDNCSCACIIF